MSTPEVLEVLNQLLAVLQKYSALGTEQQRQAMNSIFGFQNEIKRINGMQNGLLDKSLMAKRQKNEDEFRARVLPQAHRSSIPTTNRQPSGLGTSRRPREARSGRDAEAHR
jgi:hypothetical protein